MRGARHAVDRSDPPVLSVPEAVRARPWLEGVAAVAGLAVVVALVVVVKTSGPETVPARPVAPALGTPPVASAPVSVPVAGIGTTVRDGDVEFTVTGVRAGLGELGSLRPVLGEYVLVRVTAANLGGDPVTLVTVRQTLNDAAGGLHQGNARATAAGDPSGLFDAPLLPDARTTATLAFDVTPGTTPATVELRAGTGVTVDLRKQGPV